MELSALNNSVRRKLYLLYVMNVADWICTAALLRTGGFYEVNPIMRQIMHSLPLGFAVKCIMPAVIIAVIIRLTGRLDASGVDKVGRFTILILFFYLALCVNHIVNFILLFFA